MLKENSNHRKFVEYLEFKGYEGVKKIYREDDENIVARFLFSTKMEDNFLSTERYRNLWKNILTQIEDPDLVNRGIYTLSVIAKSKRLKKFEAIIDNLAFGTGVFLSLGSPRSGEYLARKLKVYFARQGIKRIGKTLELETFN